MPGSLGDLIIRIGCNLDDFSGAMSAVSARLGEVAAEVDSKLAGFDAVGGSMVKLGASMSALITLPLVALGDAAIQTAAHFEQTQIAMTHFLGSAAQAGTFLKGLYQFATQTPFQIKDLTDGAQLLMAMGFAARDVVPMLRTVGDQLSAVGRTSMLPQVILAFGEMKSFGVARMKELTQLTRDAVVPAVRYIAEYLGKTEAEVVAMTKKRMIDSATAIKAITEGMAKNSGGMMLEQMASFGGMMTNLKDNITLTLKGIGDQLIPYGKMFVNFASQFMEGTKGIAIEFGKLSDPVKAFVLSLAGVAIAIGPVLAGLGGFSLLIGVVASGLAPIAAVLGVSVLALVGWTAAIGIGAAAMASLYVASKEYIPGISAVFSSVFSDVSRVLVSAWAGIKSIFESGMASLQRSWEAGLSTVVETMFPFQAMLVENFTTIIGWVKTFSASFWQELTQDWLRSARQLAESVIPGFTLLLAVLDKLPHSDYGKIFGDAVKAAKDATNLADAFKTLGVGAGAAKSALDALKDPKTAWMDEHQRKLATMATAVTLVAAAYREGKATAKQFQDAVAAVNAEVSKKYIPPPKENSIIPGDKAKKGKTQEELDFTTLGLKDFEGDLDKATAAFARLQKGGELTQGQLIAGHIKLLELTDKVRESTLSLTGAFSAQVPYDRDGKITGGLTMLADVLLPKTNTAADNLNIALGNTEGPDKATRALDGVSNRVNALGESIRPTLGLSELGTRYLFQYADAATQAGMMSDALALGTRTLGDSFDAASFMARGLSGQVGHDLLDSFNRAHTAAAALANDDAGLATFFFNASQNSKYAAKDIANFTDNSVAAELAFKTLGITSQAELEAMAKKAYEAYTLIANDATKSAYDSDRAWLSYYDRARAAGEVFSQAAMAQTEAIRTRVQGAIRDLSNSWAMLGKQITQSISSDLSRSVGDAIFQTGKLGDAFKRMGQDVVDIILNKIIKQGVSALIDSLAGVGGMVGKLAGWFGGIAPAAGGVLGTTVGSAGGAVATIGNSGAVAANAGLPSGQLGQAVSSAVSSTLSTVMGFVSAGIAAASGIVTGMQLSHIGSDVKFIEESTRYIKKGFLDSGGLLDIVNQWFTMAQLQFDWEKAYVLGTLREIRDGIKGIVSITLTAAAGGSTADIGKSLGVYLASTNTAQTDTLLDLVFAMNKFVTLSASGFDRVVNAINTMSSLLTGQLHALVAAQGGFFGTVAKIQGLLGGGLSSIIGGVGKTAGSGLASAGSSLLGGLLDAVLPKNSDTQLVRIEGNTRFAAMYLGERGDGGILGTLFRILDTALYGTAVKALESIRDMIGGMGGLGGGDNSKDIGLIREQSYWSMLKLDRIDVNINAMAQRTQPIAAAAGGNTFNFSFTGVTSPRDMAQAVVSELKMLGVHI
jgi:tape measure domain-containing protein